MVQVKAIKAFSDNYIWCLSDPTSSQAWVVDPGQAEPVLTYLNQAGLTLAGILVTHHHYDHTDGVAALCEKFAGIDVYGPHNSPFKGITKPLMDADKITVLGTEFSIITTPGHTLDHICYLNPNLAFTGDTLFSGGCGRLFEGTAEQMQHSFDKLKKLPPECEIYCTHEYTQANLAFALAVEPSNRDLIEYAQWVDIQRQNNQITLPSTLALELKINPFMRTDITGILKRLPETYNPSTKNTLQNNEPWQNFAGLRIWKDHF
ncbi:MULTISPECIES: hydroxyacylglutathione hydrolase [unclassified Pseudoalteromonas]|uniref:hydroxyacylglutathione hydrolase n=1 Tax=unclassified Pseudoalteromonas TaxID=194690 RepID=UPI001603486C|nr:MULTISPECIES: hydroxyacylglutathione hydrolase [unclassified Pseudoalteromonas]MBB1333908.1 hydroxyacylglutathione hydrolase [Pseudoalteromonas sp. SR41-6]MBB1342184.1 hydroxyacylglutathione hydrolase [Pseudoalteromonas sp. SR45-6]MBB1459629.1 hydroxyacylglutathione hydrolase [Pseudoalteromonas sp. SG41-8]MBB1467764.1 hydroxyacylglutathione hydrolase [Pseudoalteromonas sp. SG41-5]